MYQSVMHVLSKFYCITWIGSADIAFLVFDVIVYNLCGNYGINYADVKISMKMSFQTILIHFEYKKVPCNRKFGNKVFYRYSKLSHSKFRTQSFKFPSVLN